MLRGITLLVIVTVGSFGLHAQELKIKRQTTGAAGSSAAVNLSGTQWLIQQSIGQASVIGFGKSGNRQLRQGFIQSDFSLGAVAKSTSLEVTLYPNPFGSQFTMAFDDAIEEDVHIDVTDLSGRAIFQQRFAAAQNLTVRFPEAAPGLYIIRIQTGTKQFSGRIQKLNL